MLLLAFVSLTVLNYFCQHWHCACLRNEGMCGPGDTTPSLHHTRMCAGQGHQQREFLPFSWDKKPWLHWHTHKGATGLQYGSLLGYYGYEVSTKGLGNRVNSE